MKPKSRMFFSLLHRYFVQDRRANKYFKLEWPLHSHKLNTGESNGSTGYKWLELAFSASVSNT